MRNSTKRQNFDNSNDAQRIRLLNRLKEAPVTTVDARHGLDILGVAPRIFELRWHFGYNIQKTWTNGDNPGGSRHRIARYVLLPGVWKGGNQSCQ